MRRPLVGVILSDFRRFCGYGLWLGGLLLCASLLLSGCRKSEPSRPDLVIEHEIAPRPPRVGPAVITLKMSDAGGAPQTGARISLEGNMSHAGMRPVFGEAREVEPGHYEAPIEFTMGGDWLILIHIALPDGEKLQRQFEINEVRSS